MLTESCFFVRSYTSHKLKGKKLLSSDINKLKILRSSYQHRDKQKVRIQLMDECSKLQSASKLQKLVYTLGNIKPMIQSEPHKLTRKKYSYDLTSTKDKSRNSVNSLACQDINSPESINKRTVSVTPFLNQTICKNLSQSPQKTKDEVRKQSLIRKLRSTYEDQKLLDKVIISFDDNQNKSQLQTNKFKRKYKNSLFFKSHKSKHERCLTTNSIQFSSQKNLLRLLHSQERKNRTTDLLSRRTSMGLKSSLVSR